MIKIIINGPVELHVHESLPKAVAIKDLSGEPASAAVEVPGGGRETTGLVEPWTLIVELRKADIRLRISGPEDHHPAAMVILDDGLDQVMEDFQVPEWAAQVSTLVRFKKPELVAIGVDRVEVRDLATGGVPLSLDWSRVTCPHRTRACSRPPWLSLKAS